VKNVCALTAVQCVLPVAVDRHPCVLLQWLRIDVPCTLANPQPGSAHSSASTGGRSASNAASNGAGTAASAGAARASDACRPTTRRRILAAAACSSRKCRFRFRTA
jgi:hypothetical protein